MCLDESSSAVGDPVFVHRDDRGVRHRHSKRMTEQGDDRVPTRDRSGDARLGKCA
jgi:hypothetical protein